MHVMDTLEEAIKAGYVVRRRPDFAVSNQYWRWCEANTKPFVAVTLCKPRSKYAKVEIDLYGVSLDGFPKIACYEIHRFFLGSGLKRGSTVHISPLFMSATVLLDLAHTAAVFLYQSAIDEEICLTSKEFIEIVTQRAGAGERAGRASGPSFSFDVYKDVLEQVSASEFWEAITKEF